MVNYGSLYRPRNQQNKTSTTTSRTSDTSSTTPSAANAQDSQQWTRNSGRSNLVAGTVDDVKPDAYLNFSEEQQDALLSDARANAAALLVDAIADADKWQFVTARGPLKVYELRADSMDRVSSMTPADQTQLPYHMHTMLATTRVRATLDDFMRLMASAKRDTFQNVQAALFEERVQLADVFTSFGSLLSGCVDRTSSTSSTSSRSHSQSGSETEQYAVKYVSIKGRPPRTNSGSSLNASSASNSLKFGGKNRHRERQAARLYKRKGHRRSASAEELGLTMCLAEYATIRRAHLRGPMVHHLAQDFDDQRIGIISHHSIEDPAITRYCRPIVSSSETTVTTPPVAPFAMTTRALVQFSGIVAYPVASSLAGDKSLEVLIKFSCYDGSGVTTTRRMNMLSYLTAFQHLSTALLVLRLRESPYLTSENWVKARKKCCVCDNKFSMAKRKHHCRLCGDVACSKCSEIHQIKLGKAGKCPFRICSKCDHRMEEDKQGQNHIQGATPPPKSSSNSIKALRRRIGSGSTASRHPEDDDEYNRTPSMNSSNGESTSDYYDSRSILASTTSDRTLSSMSGSTVSSSNSSRGLGMFGKSSSSKTLSISSSSFSGSFYNKPSNATTASCSRDSRADSESENDVEENENGGKEDSDIEAPTTNSVEGSKESDVVVEIDSIDAIEVSSVCSSSPSSPSSVVLQTDQFYKRFSELSLMDFHDSEFDLSVKGGLPSRLTGKSVYDFDDSEADPESDREVDLGGIGEAENEDGEEEDDGDICDFDMNELNEGDEEEDGMEFHDSNVGLDFELQDLNLHEYRGLEELEEGDQEYDEEVIEEIHCDKVLAKSRIGTFRDEERATRLAEYGIMDSGKEHIYDLVAKQAAQHSNCSLATISFVDARREFIKSSFGLTRELNDVPISHSLTAEIMRRFRVSFTLNDLNDVQDDENIEVVTVLDARQDSVLSTNLFVTEAPNLRFIMGIPFRARDGTVLGALIVADSQPRSTVPSRQRSLLNDLAEQVSALLADLWTRNQERAKLAYTQTDHLRDQLVDLLSQSYSTGLQMQQNELKMEQSTSLLSSSTYKPQYSNDLRHLQSVEL
ncbi:signal transduction histidine kinase [Plasmopara halstedii]|uniref:Signal transduction histidine kinase n=1 Tax=Plasmopara halstedii TaxID=4781 RepID=A0A0P1AEG6_PLAHL|nr:signal transduction histidine kinase [Plasmopara halstedii]CEG39405.1 signal transduction histidine kinase [Plasmopara halstedii]|eukprot:XP_024575774.1 signal transduction histidine kinase [Plasmopara halstedii]